MRKSEKNHPRHFELEILNVREGEYEPVLFFPLSVLRKSGMSKLQPTPSQVLEKRELLDAVAVILSELKPLQRRVIHLRFFEGLTLRETAVLVRRSHEIVRQIQMKALNRLKSPARRRLLLQAGGLDYKEILGC